MAVKKGKNQSGVCEQCSNYVYDEDYECYVCEVSLDEDEMARLKQDGSPTSHSDCKRSGKYCGLRHGEKGV